MVRSVLLALTLLAALPTLAQVTVEGDASVRKVLRYAFPAAESGFDPAQVTDLYSNTVLAHIFEAPLEYEYLAQPARMRPNTAAALPEISADYRRFVFQIKPGIYFADDPAPVMPRIDRAGLCAHSSATTTRAGRAASCTSWRPRAFSA
jgi:ABC-type oligopeptide transport system substrate-binding subunit